MATGAEQRKNRRFNLTLPVSVRVKAETPQVSASTQDISSGGIYLMMPQDLEPGSELDFEVTLPGEVSGGKPIQLRCRGKVLRVNRQEAGGKVGVAATIERYEFVAGE